LDPSPQDTEIKMELTLLQLQAFVDKIIREYKSYLERNLEAIKIRYAVGFHITDLQKYEHERGHYPLRSVTVVPNSSRIIDLLLIYNSEHGKIKFELNIKPIGTAYTITKNLVSRYEESETANTNGSIIMAFLTKKLRTPKLKKEEVSRVEPTQSFLCLTKDTNCCYLKPNHDKTACSACCYDQPHSVV
jgi:hypothetical protein